MGICLTPGRALMLFCGVVAGASGGAVDAGPNACGAARIDRRTMNWLHAAFGMGATIGPSVGAGVLASGLSWRWSYGAVGAAQALLAAAQLSYSLFVLDRNASRAIAGIVVALYRGALTAGRVAFGFVADRIDPVRLLRACLSGACAGALLLWSPPMLGADFAGLILMGASLAPVFATLVSMTPARVGRTHSDSAIGFEISAAAMGGALVTMTVAAESDRFGSEAVGPLLFPTSILLFAAHEVVARPAIGGDDRHVP